MQSALTVDGVAAAAAVADADFDDVAGSGDKRSSSDAFVLGVEVACETRDVRIELPSESLHCSTSTSRSASSSCSVEQRSTEYGPV